MSEASSLSIALFYLCLFAVVVKHPLILCYHNHDFDAAAVAVAATVIMVVMAAAAAGVTIMWCDSHHKGKWMGKRTQAEIRHIAVCVMSIIHRISLKMLGYANEHTNHPLELYGMSSSYWRCEGFSLIDKMN